MNFVDASVVGTYEFCGERFFVFIGTAGRVRAIDVYGECLSSAEVLAHGTKLSSTLPTGVKGIWLDCFNGEGANFDFSADPSVRCDTGGGNETKPLGDSERGDSRSAQSLAPSHELARSPRESDFSKNISGFARIKSVCRERAVVSDSVGRLTAIDLESMAVWSSVYVGEMNGLACSTLMSLDVHAELNLCAVATRGGYGVLWTIGEHKYRKLRPHMGGPVNSVTFLPKPLCIVLGLGWYPLGNDHEAHAAIEVWSLESTEPQLMHRVALPGVCVNEMTYSRSLDELVCHTGTRSQKGGFLSRMDATSLVLKEVQDTDDNFIVAMNFTDSSRENELVLCSSRHVSCASSDDNDGCSAFEWHRTEASSEIWGAAFDPTGKRLALSNGSLYRVAEGKCVHLGAMDVPVECSDVAFRHEGGLVAVSRAGVVRCWDSDDGLIAE